jgi:hypothetical protein
MNLFFLLVKHWHVDITLYLIVPKLPFLGLAGKDIIKAFTPSVEARGHGGRNCLFHASHLNVKCLFFQDYTFIGS